MILIFTIIRLTRESLAGIDLTLSAGRQAPTPFPCPTGQAGFGEGGLEPSFFRVLKAKRMKTIVLNIFLCFIAALAFSQDIRKGETVYFQNDSKNESAADVAEELRSKLGGYFNFTNDKNKADHIMKLHIETGRGITLTSWGGKSILCSVTMISKNGEIICVYSDLTERELEKAPRIVKEHFIQISKQNKG